MTKFKLWLEEFDSSTPASDEVKRTGLQPQVDRDIHAKSGEGADLIGAIDGNIDRINVILPEKDAAPTKVNKFMDLWQSFKDQWETIKQSDSENGEEDAGLADTEGNKKYLDMMKQNPNMVPQSPNVPAGPGTFGVS